jgi:hypothetical protein
MKRPLIRDDCRDSLWLLYIEQVGSIHLLLCVGGVMRLCKYPVMNNS